MVNEIKFDKIPSYPLDNQADRKTTMAKEEAPNEEVTVTNRMSEWLGLINGYEEPTSNNAVNNIKHLIQHNEYKVDLDKLSEKMLNSGVLTSVGE